MFKPRTIWRFAPIISAASLSLAALIFGFLLYQQIASPRLAERDGEWAAFEMAYEYNRLVVAAETNSTPFDIKLRGEIYLSRVDVLRETHSISDVREEMPEMLAQLYASAERTSDLIEQLDRPGGRAALLAELRSDAMLVRTTMLEFIRISRDIRIARAADDQRTLVGYLSALLVLILLLLGMRILINFKLRKAGRALTAELATREGILGSVDAAILGIGKGGEVLYSNRNALELLGPVARRGARLLEVPSVKGSLLGEIAATLRKGLGRDAEDQHGMLKIRVEQETGVRHYVIRTSSPEPLHAAQNGGAESSLILVVTDVTTEEEAALRREEYDVKLAEASRVLAYAAMSGGIVHEISQPLAAMRNYVYAMKGSANTQPDNEQAHMVDQLGVEIDRAIEVVRNIRLMGPQSEQEIGACDAHEAIAHSIRLVSLGANPPAPITTSPVERPVLITGSLPIVGQVIVNLLKNALSASSAAGRSGAKVDVKIAGGSAEIAISDFGHGVSEDAAKSMFAPFTRSSRGGMGLGLSICQRIATGLGGSLSWENSGSSGAVFRFRVPLATEAALQ
jgi:signal transduction histidine kinase